MNKEPTTAPATGGTDAPAPSRRLAGVIGAVAAGALAAAGVAVAAGGASAADANLLTNAGFEAGTLAGWSCSANSGSVVTSPVHSGSHALSATPAGSDDAQCTQTVSVQPNSSYTLSAWVQGSYVYLGATGTGGTDPSTWGSSTAWNQLSTSFTTGASTTSVTVYLHGWYGQGTYYGDDVSLLGPGGTGSTSSPPTTPSSPTTPSTSPTSSAPPPPPDTGFNHPAYFMPLDNSPQAISDVVNAGEKELNLAFVLDSGGCTPAWGGNASTPVSSDTTVAADISALRAAGGDAAVSFGGYNGTELGSSCGSANALAAAYQQVIAKYQLKHVDFDYENTALDSNTAVRFGAIKILEQNNPGLVVSLTIPMTTVGFPGSGVDEIKQAVAAGARLDVVNIMDFDTGLTSGTEVGQTEAIANDAITQLQSIYGWTAAQAWSHLGLQIMNGHTDQPSELFQLSDFSALLGFAQANHPAWFSYWSANRDRACDPSVPHNWADGACSSVTQNPWDFTKILVQYTG
ncbi:carbohydrate binding domain-containing protein [Catenulispora pinisilvae]|uniref:carbohydrate binding domain-containing protein n=1 Tax=Catenulispora pinisilvae TaxID=2705253 RepID=UPI001891670D|nr:carbohydrate binding domain-containing protein [Catenulispora pinisilvae]